MDPSGDPSRNPEERPAHPAPGPRRLSLDPRPVHHRPAVLDPGPGQRPRRRTSSSSCPPRWTPRSTTPSPKDIYSLGRHGQDHPDRPDGRQERQGHRRREAAGPDPGVSRAPSRTTRSWPRRSGSSRPRARRDEEELKRALVLFEEYLKLSQNANFQSIIPALRDHTPDRIADIIASHMFLPLDEKQNLLETINSRERVRHLLFLLEKENFRLGQAESRKDGKSGLGRRKTPFGREAGQGTFSPGGAAGSKKDDQAGELEELKKKVVAARMPPDAADKARKEIERLESMPPMSAEATVCRNYLDWLIALPWAKKSREKRDLKDAERILNEDHYGLEKVKERILEYLSIRQLVKNPKGVILGLIGPPGVGKTSLGKSDRPGHGPEVRPPLARRRPGRGRDPGPPPDLHRRLPRPDHPDDQAGRDPESRLPPRRGRQDEHGLPGRSRRGPHGSPRPRAEQRLPRPLHRHRFRPVPGHVHRHGQHARPHPAAAHRPDGDHPAPRLHGGREAPDRQASSCGRSS